MWAEKYLIKLVNKSALISELILRTLLVIICDK